MKRRSIDREPIIPGPIIPAPGPYPGAIDGVVDCESAGAPNNRTIAPSPAVAMHRSGVTGEWENANLCLFIALLLGFCLCSAWRRRGKLATAAGHCLSDRRPCVQHWPGRLNRAGLPLASHGHRLLHTAGAARKRRSKEELTITDNELRAMAAPAIIGLSQPKAAIGMPMML